MKYKARQKGITEEGKMVFVVHKTKFHGQRKFTKVPAIKKQKS